MRSINVQIQLLSILRACLPEGAERGQATVELPEGATLNDLFDQLRLERCLSGAASFAEQLDSWQISLNGAFTQDLDQILRDQDKVIVFPHIAGG
jgi:molybdopterin converting factor small subunit